jgi:hypothetical protein
MLGEGDADEVMMTDLAQSLTIKTKLFEVTANGWFGVAALVAIACLVVAGLARGWLRAPPRPRRK